MTREQKETVKTLRRRGLGYGAIAETTGISRNTVKSFCQREAAKNPADEHRCLCCGVLVAQTPGHKEKRFCSDECRLKYWKEHFRIEKSKKAEAIKCKNCGKTFYAYRTSNRKYCCRNCYFHDRFRKSDRE